MANKNDVKKLAERIIKLQEEKDGYEARVREIEAKGFIDANEGNTLKDCKHGAEVTKNYIQGIWIAAHAMNVDDALMEQVIALRER